jgi:hypothetical protein
VSSFSHRIFGAGLCATFAICAIVGTTASAASERPVVPTRAVPASPSPGANGKLGDAARRALHQGYLVPDQRAYDRTKARASGANPSLALTSPIFEKRAPGTLSSWQGLSDTDFAPSDSTGAVGTQRFIQLVNSQFGIYDKGSTAPMASGSLNTLAGASSADTLFDVQVIWDPTTKRFYYTMINSISQTNNDLAFGFSKSSSPSSGSSSDWCKYSIDFGSQFPDYPKLGDSQYFAVIGVNLFTSSTSIFLGAEALAVKKPGSGSGCPSSLSVTSKSPLMSNGSTPAFTPVPANEIDTKQNGWIAAIPSLLPSKKISLFKVKKKNGQAKIQGTATQLKVNQYDAPPNAPQSGNSVRIDTLDGRLTQAVAATDTGHNDKFALWTQHTVSGGAGSKVRWYEIYPSDPKLIQNGSVSDSSKYDFDGAISPNRAVNGSDKSGGKDMVLNFVASSGSSFPAIKMVSKKGGNSQSGQVAVKQSPGPIAGFDCSSSGGGAEPDGTSSQLCRWGDYASATPDPSNSSRIWNVSQWASGNKPACTTVLNCPATWRTQIFVANP